MMRIHEWLDLFWRFGTFCCQYGFSKCMRTATCGLLVMLPLLAWHCCRRGKNGRSGDLGFYSWLLLFPAALTGMSRLFYQRWSIETAKRLQCSGTHLDQQGLLCGDAGAGGLVDGQKEDFVPKTPKAPLLVFFEWNFSQRNGGLAGLCQAGNRRRSLETGSLVSGTGSGLYKR